MYFERDVSGKHCPRSALAARAPFILTSCTGCGPVSSWPFGAQGLLNTMKWRASLGAGKASTEPWSKPLWPNKQLVPIPLIGGKKGSKRHLLTDGRGVPLSIVVTGANKHDVSQLGLVLDAIVIERPEHIIQHLCADKGYAGAPALEIIMSRNYIPHVKQRGEEIREKRIIPGYKARRWVVEVSHSWFNRFRKLLVRYEKLTETYLALLQMAAAIIAFRKTRIIYG